MSAACGVVIRDMRCRRKRVLIFYLLSQYCSICRKGGLDQLDSPVDKAKDIKRYQGHIRGFPAAGVSAEKTYPEEAGKYYQAGCARNDLLARSASTDRGDTASDNSSSLWT